MELEQAVKQSPNERYVYPDVFEESVGLDIVDNYKKLHAARTWGHIKNNMKRRATLNITSWMGISIGAIHFYGEIQIQGVEMECNDKPGVYQMVFDRNIPLSHSAYILKLKRPLTKRELDEDPVRWECFQEGDMIESFETIEDIFSLAKEVFRLRFKGDWAFYSDFDGCTELILDL